MVAAVPLPAAVEGFLLGAGLIVAIGAQNAFVLRQGLLRSHALPITTLCFLSDAVLIAAGVGGLGRLVRQAPEVTFWLTLAGAAFVAGYGIFALMRAMRPGSLAPAGVTQPSLRAALATCLALTLLNPHVYLDTVVLIGALSARYDPPDAIAFGVGAAISSAVWFYGLGFGARVLAPVFARPRAWRILDVAVGIVMLAIAARLAGEALYSN